ncbi:MAG: ABC transporter ATP-binding protein [Erysipelotrichia bacterium]|nr:ABC transporter ATP-binding protein [Erysipelotrichia bacterium]NCC55127.1 ABC transporter ATP-binding protein [Erysipelotrichia bacterium]
MSIVEIKDVSKMFGRKEVLKNINLTIEKGKIIGLLGTNESGKTTLIKLINDLLVASKGEILINGQKPGVESKKVISYLPERTYLNANMKVSEMLDYFIDFYEDFDREKACRLLADLGISESEKLKTMSKGTKEKVQLILVMSRKADLYILDEPIGGVDPAARDYILDTILTNFNKEASILICTHLIADIERVLDDVIFISKGEIVENTSADELRDQHGKSIDEIFREEFKC